MSLLTRAAAGLATRALPGAHQGIGNTIPQPRQSGRGPRAATGNVTYATPGLPQTPMWDGRSAVDQGYYGSMWVMRCVRTIADTIAGLPYRAGPSVETPGKWDAGAPLARLLGPAPGGPNPTTTARAFWAWSIVQYLVTGRFAWELQTDPATKQIVGLWPLVSAYLEPIPSQGGTRWWDGFVYRLPNGERTLRHDQVLYVQRPSAKDWREPESYLQAASLPISVQIAIDRYMWGLLKNGMVASTMVVTPPFEEADQRRAWQEQFLQEFTGFDQAGRTIFAEFDDDDGLGGKASGSAGKGGPVQVERLAESPVDAQLVALAEQAKIDITVSLGVPMSLIGNASQRTYSNADSEYRNFWTMTVLPLLSELQDPVNLQLAPRLGSEVGWFDLRRVVALQPSTSFVPPSVKDLQGLGLSARQILEVVGVTQLEQQGEDVATAPVGEEATVSGPVGTGSSASGAIPGGGRSAEVLEDVVVRLERLRAGRERRAVSEAGPSGPGSMFTGLDPDPSGSGLLLPQASPKPPKPREVHGFAGRDLTSCAKCGQPVNAPVHRRREARHAGAGHAPVPSGHVAGSPARLRAALLADGHRLADGWQRTLEQVADDQWHATQDRLGGKRGRQLQRRAAIGVVDAAHVFDVERWTRTVGDMLAPHYETAAEVAEARTGRPADRGALDEHRAAVAARLVEGTFGRLGSSLRAGVEAGDDLNGLADRVTAVFDTERAQAPRLARRAATAALGLAARPAGRVA